MAVTLQNNSNGQFSLYLFYAPCFSLLNWNGTSAVLLLSLPTSACHFVSLFLEQEPSCLS